MSEKPIIGLIFSIMFICTFIYLIIWKFFENKCWKKDQVHFKKLVVFFDKEFDRIFLGKTYIDGLWEEKE